jgi:ribosomal protein L11 methyltransferase
MAEQSSPNPVGPASCSVTVRAAPALAERVAAALETAEPAPDALSIFDAGAGACDVVAYYAADADRAMLERLVASAAGEPVAVRLESVGSADWVARSQSLRGPVCAGRFLVHGSHDRGRIARNRFTVEIDAASAFGTAHHASTRGCLLALDRVLKTARPRSVLDIGTGTGILAIAAAKTMRVDALASDNDPVAARIAADNAKKNGVAGSVRVVEAEGLSHPALRSARPDLLLANLLLNPLLALAPQFARALRGGGMCVLAGVTRDQVPALEARFRSLGFRLKSRILLDGWATVLLQRGNTRKV